MVLVQPLHAFGYRAPIYHILCITGTFLFIRTVSHKWHFNRDINNNFKTQCTKLQNKYASFLKSFLTQAHKALFKHQPWHFSLTVTLPVNFT